jgi:hypothetical protein
MIDVNSVCTQDPVIVLLIYANKPGSLPAGRRNLDQLSRLDSEGTDSEATSSEVLGKNPNTLPKPCCLAKVRMN